MWCMHTRVRAQCTCTIVVALVTPLPSPTPPRVTYSLIYHLRSLTAFAFETRRCNADNYETPELPRCNCSNYHRRVPRSVVRSRGWAGNDLSVFGNRTFACRPVSFAVRWPRKLFTPTLIKPRGMWYRFISKRLNKMCNTRGEDDKSTYT